MKREQLSHLCHKWSRRVVIVFGIGLLSAPALASAETVRSQWRSSEARVDGLITDWTVLTSVSSEVAVGAVNDGVWLHLVIRASETGTLQRLMSSGLIVYLDAAGNRSRAFGVRIPPLRGARGMPIGPRGRGASSDPLPASPTAGPGSPQALTYVEVLGPGEDEAHIVDLGRTGVSPLEAAAGDFEGSLLIELAVPLRPGDRHPYSPGLPEAQTVVGLGLVTPDPPPVARGGRDGGTAGRGGGMPRGGTPPGGAMGGRGMGGPGMDGPARDPGKAVNVWTTIELATEAAQ